MKKNFLLLSLFALTLAMRSCRETEMNTDGKMEKHETREGALEETGT